MRSYKRSTVIVCTIDWEIKLEFFTYENFLSLENADEDWTCENQNTCLKWTHSHTEQTRVKHKHAKKLYSISYCCSCTVVVSILPNLCKKSGAILHVNVMLAAGFCTSLLISAITCDGLSMRVWETEHRPHVVQQSLWKTRGVNNKLVFWRSDYSTWYMFIGYQRLTTKISQSTIGGECYAHTSTTNYTRSLLSLHLERDVWIFDFGKQNWLKKHIYYKDKPFTRICR